MSRTYSGLLAYSTLLDRFRYLKLNGKVAYETFGSRRYLNQQFYTSKEYKQFRLRIIERDNGCELGCKDHPIMGHIYVHHITPITEKDLLERTDLLLSEDNAISCSFCMHNAIHYGDESLLPSSWEPRRPNDTIPWR